MEKACYSCDLDDDMCIYCVHNGYDPKTDLEHAEMKGFMNAKKAILSLVSEAQSNASIQDKSHYNAIWDSIFNMVQNEKT